MGHDLDRGIARVKLKGLETFSDKAFTVDKKGSVCAAKAVWLGVWTQIGLHTKIKMPSGSPQLFHTPTSSLSCFSDFLSDGNQDISVVPCLFLCAPEGIRIKGLSTERDETTHCQCYTGGCLTVAGEGCRQGHLYLRRGPDNVRWGRGIT